MTTGGPVSGDGPEQAESAQGGAERLARLARQVGEALGEAGVRLRAWRSGVDFWADLAYVDDRLLGVLRSPRHEVLVTAYEGSVDFGAVVEREVIVFGLLAKSGVPVPRIHAWHRRREPDERSWMLCEQVPHEPVETLTPALQVRLGAIAKEIHAISAGIAALLPDQPWPRYMATRLGDRLRSARGYCPELPVDQLLGIAEPLLAGRSGVEPVLLHMDLRPANLCVRDGQIAAVLDVANAVAGDPLLELARIRNYGLLTSDFQAGYGRSGEWLRHHARVLDLYELDTAALLTVVAVEEIQDEALHAQSRRRLLELSAALR